MKVLLVPANFYAAEGAVARAIVRLCPEIEFYYFRAQDIQRRFEEFLSLAKSVDCIHWIMNLSNIGFPQNFDFQKLNAPSIATVHHVMEHEYKKIEFAEKADLIHAVSEPWEHFLKTRTNTPVFLACGGVDYEKLSTHQKIKEPGKIFKFGLFGMAHSRKRPLFFLEALKKLKNKNFEVVFQGQGWEKYAQSFERENIKIRILGRSSYEDSWKAYGKVDCYVCSSEIEGGPLGILEALSSGVPVVSTEVGMAGPLLGLGGGVIVPIHDVEGFSGALSRMMEDTSFYSKCRRDAAIVAAKFCRSLPDDYRQMYAKVIDLWNAKNSMSWTYKASEGVSGFVQRKKEINIDLLSESLDLFKSGRPAGGFILWLKVFCSGQFSFLFLTRRLIHCFMEFLRKKINHD